ncbi:MAG TPA: glycosyltransferase family 4 protein [Actinospica sp.]|jgi:glycosyltransferase involved in cell wall biosynthesis|nr:glycosyltransferase family 4 protein [Actinospica sp.]
MTETQGRHVVIVCNNIDEAGGAQRWARSMGELLSGRGHHVHLVGIAGVEKPHDYAAEYGGPLPYTTSTLYDKPVNAVPRPALDVRIRKPAALLRHKKWLKLKAHGAGKLGAILAELPRTAVVICVQVFAMEWIALADTHGIPVIGMSHESFAASMASSRGRRVKQYYAKLPRFVALTEQDARDWTTKGRLNNAAAVPNPLPFPADGGADPAARTCVALGRLSQEKGFDLLLEAWATAVKARPGTDWKLRIYGDGGDREELRNQAASLGIDDSVTFEGATNRVAEALRGGSVFVSASRAEGFPMTLLEALACGVPCVAFDCAPGVREILRGDRLPAGTYGMTENGVLVAPGNTDAFAEQLGRLLDDATLRRTLAKAAADSVARYAPEVIAERWESLFALVHR